ncbi:apolipoprotein D-like [Hyalella azteca]|uniref:Apolipoprotein D-like n=1 Tax=Hyalella azteca TaxID=294128 RepID=A0A8B7N5N3_HYAAZ|nr:apolipoprotein D-like [Hyalella azteca]
MAVLAPGAQASVSVRGSCPAVAAVSDFNMTRFEGLWYVIEVFDKGVACMEWKIAPMEADVWHIKETKQSGYVGEYNGKLTRNDNSSGSLTVNWDANIGRGFPFTVYATDYDTYAGAFMCQQVWFFNRQEGVILSRSPVLHIAQRQQTRGMLSRYGVEMSYFSKVEQGLCGRTSLPDAGAGSDNKRFDEYDNLSSDA